MENISQLDLRAEKEDPGILALELLAAWACREDVPINDEDVEWIGDQVALGTLERAILPPDVFQRAMQIYESVELTDQIMRRM